MGEAGVGTLTSKGQITVPKDIRDAIDAHAGDKIVFERVGERVFLPKVARESLDAVFRRHKPWKVDAVKHQRPFATSGQNSHGSACCHFGHIDISGFTEP